MKVRGIDDKEYKFPVDRSAYPLRSEAGCRSGVQYRCGQVLASIYPFDPILEDVPVPPRAQFYLDFWLPKRKLAIEVQGEQHTTYTPFFHGTKDKYYRAMSRDRGKLAFCEKNDITLYCVDSPEQLKELLLG